MARKIKKKISRKELLKEDDEFITFTDEAVEWSRENWPLLLIAAGVFAVMVVVVILIRSSIDDSRARLQHQIVESVNSLNASMQSEAMALFNPEATPEDAKKGYEDSAYKLDKLLKDFPKTNERHIIQFSLANSYFKGGEYEKARESYKTLIEKEGQGSLADLAKYNIGMSYFLEGKYSEALTSFRELVESETPTGRAGSLVYGGHCFKELGQVDKAEEYYKLALDAYSDSKLTLGLDSSIEKLKIQSKDDGGGAVEPSPDAMTPEPGGD